jgi:carboxypeptidase C (cathepsin A)
MKLLNQLHSALFGLIVTAAFVIASASASSSPQLHHPSHYQVNRSLLENGYPAFKTFKGQMHSGLIPAISLKDANGNVKENVDDYSSYFFWLFRPDGGDDSEGKPESFRDDTLLIWLNGELHSCT